MRPCVLLNGFKKDNALYFRVLSKAFLGLKSSLNSKISMFLTSELVLILEGLLWNKSFLAFRIRLKAFKK